MLGSLIGIWPRNRRTGRASLRRYILSFTNQSSPRLETTRGSRRCDCSPNVARRATTAPEDGGERRQHDGRSEEHTSELQSHSDLVCRLLLEKKNNRQ